MHVLLDPTILFFAFGLFAGLVRSNLEIPAPVSRFLCLYLLMALGLKGGFALAASGLTGRIAGDLGLAMVLALLVPVAGYQWLRRWLSPLDAAAVAATYGSVSAVTFVTTVQILDLNGVPYGGHMAAAMALMESPAILFAVVLANRLRVRSSEQTVRFSHVMHESLTDGAQLLLLGSMAVGYISGPAGKAVMAPFSIDLFKGMLAFFLLDMGLQTARQLPALRGRSPWLVGYALFAPVIHATVAWLLATLAGTSAGNTVLLMALAASASYIAAPAVLRQALPEANPSLYVGLSLGVTFPFNILIGIPLYLELATRGLPW